ncbi:unnamed protein product [Urochloa humidicola]
MEAESTGTPFILVCNMVELVDEQERELVAVGHLAASVVSVPSLDQLRPRMLGISDRVTSLHLKAEKTAELELVLEPWVFA